VVQQELHGPQVASSPINQGRLSPSQPVGAVKAGVQANPIDPARDEPGVLPRCQRPTGKRWLGRR
jgi:hypothetical protein